MKTNRGKKNYSPKGRAICLRLLFGRSLVGPGILGNSNEQPSLRATTLLGLPQPHWTLHLSYWYDAYCQQVLGWPKSSFRLFRKMVQRTRTNFLASPILPLSQKHHSRPVADFPFSISPESYQSKE